jgi:hypothetical protein
MKKSLVIIIVFLMAVLPSLSASEKPAKAVKKSSRTECKAKKVVYFYPTIKAKKQDSTNNKKNKKGRNRGHAFPI